MSDLKIFADIIEDAAKEQIDAITKSLAFKDSKIRIMPDVHAGKGCVIGFTADIIDKVIPNVVGVDIGCLDCGTEYLTPQGWRFMNNYENSKVLGFNPQTNEAEFVYPLAYIKKECNEFFHYKNSKGLDQMVSEEHKMLVYKGYKSKGYTHLDMNPEELNSKPLDKGYYSFETTFSTKGCDSDVLNISDNTIRVDVMIAADGRIRDNRLELHFKKERKIQRAKELLGIEGIEYTEGFNADGSTTIYCTIGDFFNKDLTKYFIASTHQLAIVAEESLKWDGHEGYRSYYCSTNKNNIDVIQYAFHASGIRAGISLQPQSNKNWKPCYCVTPTKNPKVGYCLPTRVESPDGYKYCFTMPQGYFVARRNGKIFITGNCGVMGFNLGNIDIDFKRLDRVIKQQIPFGLAVRSKEFKSFPFEKLKCFNALQNVDRLKKSLGTLGGGNHYIEVDVDSLGNKYIVVHSGSRNLGLQVAKYYQEKAKDYCDNEKRKQDKEFIIKFHKATNTEDKIQKSLERYEREHPPIPSELAYLEGELMEDYLHDMAICQNFANENRLSILLLISAFMGWENTAKPAFNVIHNYIDIESNIVRKGAVSAKENETVLIPINMRDGCILARGLGNPDYNYSAPHGAGRLMSRKAAKENITLEDFKNSMSEVYTSTVDSSTLDEAPMAYKPMESILENIKDTVEIIDILKPLYNFKGGN